MVNFWRDPPGRRTSTSVEVERAVALIFIILRLSHVTAMTIGAGLGVATSTRPWLYAGLTATVAVFALTMSWHVWSRQRLEAHPWGTADLVMTVAAFIGCAHLLPAYTLLGSWAGWAAGYAIGTAAEVGTWRTPRWRVVVLSTALGAVYAAVMFRYSTSDWWSIVANALTYPMFGVGSAVVVGYLRRLARQADRARQVAAAASAQIEMDRYRLTVHDASTILQLLGRDDTSPVMLHALRRQALAESNRLRAYLSDRPVPSLGDPDDEQDAAACTTLGAAVTQAVDGFTDLPLELSIDLGAPARLEEVTGLAVQRALVTVLHNVRRHAHAHEVVIHADSDGTAWELSIRDDGVGFDLGTTRLGYGLGVQVVRSLGRLGVTTRIDSEPGAGTSVVLRGHEAAPALASGNG